MACLNATTGLAANIPSGFVEEPVGSGWNEVVGLTFAPDGRMYAWERGGKVWIMENGVKSATPFIDLREEVGGWRDFGLLGFCLDPNFNSNGYVYLFYVVDHHHLKNFGTPAYSPTTDEYYQATIERITRYTARASDGFRSVDYATRKILLGESITNGPCVLHESHGAGTILFGADGTLLASTGDGASYSSTDTGSASETYYRQGLDEGIIRPKENIGSYRAQLVDSLSGKILRLDPSTGDGLPSNPFYDPGNPRAARSRVWAMGLRNPCRMTRRPGTGSANPADANPGVLYIGNVGWRTWEELYVCTRPGQNFGWPVFEGINVNSTYYNNSPENQDAPNPLYPATGCGPYFQFRHLIKQANTNATLQPPFNNPCNTSIKIPTNVLQFLHSPPPLDWKHDTTQARTWIYNSGGVATNINIGAAGSPVSGAMFPGNCSIGGIWYTHTQFPAPYRNTYFHAEYGAQWIKSFVFDANNRPVSVQDFADSAGGVVFVTMEPQTGYLYYIPWTASIQRIRYLSGANAPPTAVAQSDKNFGPAPLAVQFNGASSSDPEGQALTFDWNFGDGTPHSTSVNPSHTFNAPTSNPTPYTVTLVVTDPAGARATNTLLISVNNTPPQVAITSPVDGTRYPLTSSTTYDCLAIISDTEYPSGQLSCTWQTFLHHNEHEHEDPPVNNCTTTTVISPVGCDGETYYYRVVLTVSDPAGLSTTREVRLYPDCPKQTPVITWNNPAAIAAGTPLGATQLNATANVPGTFVYDPPAGTVLPVGNGQTLSTAFAPTDTNTYAAATKSVLINVTNPPPTISITSPTNGTLFFGPNPTIAIAAGVNANGASISSVEFFGDGMLLGTDSLVSYGLVWDTAPDGVHVLRARALYGPGLSVTSAAVSIVVASPPAAPTNLVASAVSSGQIVLGWKAGSTNQAGFKIERSTSGTSYTPIATNAANATNFLDTGLQPSTAYTYRVRAFNAQGESPFSNPAGATTPAFTAAKINFQPGTAPIPPGYVADDGSVFGARGNGLSYGWDVDNTANTVDRNSTRSPDQRYDTFAYSQRVGGGSVWELAVPNGLYHVSMVAGDPNNFAAVYSYEIEGLPTVLGTPNNNTRWIAGSNTVTVADGRLTVRNGANASNNRICFIDVTEAAVRLAWVDKDAAGRVTIRIDGTTGRQYLIQASNDLLDWTPVATVTNSGTVVSFPDQATLSQPWRFYRAVASP